MRKSERIAMAVPVEVTGTDRSGHAFSEKTQVHAISRHGAAIVLNLELRPGEKLTLRCVETGKEAEVRVVGKIGAESSGLVYGLALLDPSVNLWDIEFPPMTESEKAVARVLLECDGCQSREVAYLNELEAELFEAKRGLTRPCKRCAAPTVWKEVSHQAASEQLPLSVEAPEAAVVPARTVNERKDVRIPLKMTACILRPGLEEEVVIPENVSRSGLCFKSAGSYQVESKIQVAIPYNPGGANIFYAAEIIYAQELPEGLIRYGVAYLQPHES